MARKLLFVTGTRADFGKLEPLAAEARDAGFEISFFVTGMHLLERYGLTKLEVQRFEGAQVHEFLNQRPGDPQDIVLAKTVTGFSDFLAEHQPDLVIVHGDRIEALATTIVCGTNNIRCAHVEGGEVSGTIDEVFRHCNTKLAHSHFVSSDVAADRVRRMGEDTAAIHVIGSPELDFHSRPSGVTLEEVKARYQIPFDEFGICTFHPVTSEQANMADQARSLFETITASGRNFVVILPNNDPGAEGILEAIAALPQDQFRAYPSMRFSYFSELMKHAACMVGNSSAGVREAPFLGIPSLDVGTRQTNRAASDSVTVCSAFDTDTIADFLANNWGQRHARHSGYGEGRAATRFVEVLNTPEFWSRGLQKVFHDPG
ncbi:UDP-N-acetylglucosamine 2-epimerase (hydrolyzing) [Aliishimia ponticola]|uniref:UDP-N-acetylglucosamine 2-epimerase (Hydrolyzing) n=1 Tax=Aliishimia ponticola TaxID=2499833 RepID=A0A4S4NBL5_9RHOB|nr:UDP-N-acetylglucosamine 2-epimerase [Aliishimia ponticola]THH36729.1 UDP-N-acetylglucosamine 2-epimerase (hydrolyzing) [Aliishimia ponticola]